MTERACEACVLALGTLALALLAVVSLQFLRQFSIWRK